MADDSGKLQHRTQQAFDRMHRRVKNLELVTVSRQQLEDLLKMVPLVNGLLNRMNRVENQLTHNRESRDVLFETDNLIASEVCFVRDRLLKIEASLTGSSSAGSIEAGSSSAPSAPARSA